MVRIYAPGARRHRRVAVRQRGAILGRRHRLLCLEKLEYRWLLAGDWLAAVSPAPGEGEISGAWDDGAFGNESDLPRVASIARLDADPTGAFLVRFSVAFTEPVTGVDPGDFWLSAAVSLTGPSSTDEGGVYTVTLDSGGIAGITSWTIDWGDGTVQTVPGNPATVEHTYSDGPARPMIQASATHRELQTFARTRASIWPGPRMSGLPRTGSSVSLNL